MTKVSAATKTGLLLGAATAAAYLDIGFLVTKDLRGSKAERRVRRAESTALRLGRRGSVAALLCAARAHVLPIAKYRPLRKSCCPSLTTVPPNVENDDAFLGRDVMKARSLSACSQQRRRDKRRAREREFSSDRVIGRKAAEAFVCSASVQQRRSQGRRPLLNMRVRGAPTASCTADPTPPRASERLPTLGYSACGGHRRGARTRGRPALRLGPARPVAEGTGMTVFTNACGVVPPRLPQPGPIFRIATTVCGFRQ